MNIFFLSLFKKKIKLKFAFYFLFQKKINQKQKIEHKKIEKTKQKRQKKKEKKKETNWNEIEMQEGNNEIIRGPNLLLSLITNWLIFISSLSRNRIFIRRRNSV